MSETGNKTAVNNIDKLGIGLTQFYTTIPAGYVLIIARPNQEFLILKDQPAEILVTPILSFKSKINLMEIECEYKCEIIPHPTQRHENPKFHREVDEAFQKDVEISFDTQKAILINESAYPKTVQLAVYVEGCSYSCQITFDVTNKFWKKVIEYYKKPNQYR